MPKVESTQSSRYLRPFAAVDARQGEYISLQISDRHYAGCLRLFAID
jgi:hypothetical protein